MKQILGLSAIAFIALWMQSPVSGAIMTIDESRTLKALTVELIDGYGYLISYEEAPYDRGSLLVDNTPRPSGLPYQLPAYVRTNFTVPDPPQSPDGQPPFPTPGDWRTLPPSAVISLIQQHASAGNPGSFTALFEGRYAHIVPQSQIVNGHAVPFGPILSTIVNFSSIGKVL